jgi:hypothetical protein
MHLSIGSIVVAAAFIVGSPLRPAQEQPPLPPNHPPVPKLPQGHPPIGRPGEQEPVAPRVDPKDVGTIAAILETYYACISGPAGQGRDWNRFRALFMPEARFVTPKQMGDAAMPVSITPEQFIATNRNYFERGGYFETEIGHHVDTFGNIAQVFSTYEARRRADDQPYSRGINSIQLLNDGTRWWIVNVMWEFERPDVPIPEQYRALAEPANR